VAVLAEEIMIDTANTSTDWYLVSATVFLGLVAIFGPFINKIAERKMYSPKLEVKFKLAPPFCHLTQWSLHPPSPSEPVYYFRFWVQNVGKSRARGCEAVLKNIWIDDGTQKRKIQNFSPVNLQWTAGLIGQPPPQYIDINPEERGYFCNIGHISSKGYQQTVELRTFKDASEFPSCTADHLRFKFDLLQEFNAQSNYICPGIKYTLEIGIYSENANYIKVFLDILWSGNWKNTQEELFETEVIDIQLRGDETSNPGYNDPIYEKVDLVDRTGLP
jgi:hypothetical protein